MEKQKTVKVASIQCSSKMGDSSENIKRITPLIKEAAHQGSKFVVLPETSITGYLSQDLKTNWRAQDRTNEEFHFNFPFEKDPLNHAETCPGPSTKYFAELAKELGIYITVPFLEIETKENKNYFYNTVCLVDKTGEIGAHYRKNNPWPHPEKHWATKGENLAVFDTEYGKVGLAICFDIHSILIRYAEENIWTLLYPIAWVGDPFFWFRKQLPNLLKKCNVPFNIVGANWSVEEEKTWNGYGLSTIYGPAGEILAENNKFIGDSICYAELKVGDINIKFNKEEYEKWTKSEGACQIF